MALLYMGVYLISVRQFDASFAGLVIGLGGIGTALGALPGGIIADRWGRRPAMLSGGTVAAATLLGMGFATRQTAMLALALVLGIAVGLNRPAFTAAIIDVVPDGQRVRALNLNYWAFNLGSGLAALLAVMLIRVEPLLLFATNAGMLLFSTILLAWKVPETKPSLTATPGKPSAGLGAVFRDRTFMTFVGLTLLGWSMIETNKILPVSVLADGLDITAYGRIIAVHMGLIVIGQLFLPGLTARLRHEHVLAAAVLIAGVGFGLGALANGWWAYAATVAIWTFGEMLMTVTNSALTMELSPADARGRYQGVFGAGLTAATFLGPTLGGFIADHFGSNTLWAGVFCAGTVVAVANLAAGRARARQRNQLLTMPPTVDVTQARLDLNHQT